MKNAYETFKDLPDDSTAQEVYLESCVNHMDNDLREKLHALPGIEDEAAFLCLYCQEHFNKFGEEFVVN